MASLNPGFDALIACNLSWSMGGLKAEGKSAVTNGFAGAMIAGFLESTTTLYVRLLPEQPVADFKPRDK
jgi:hypothetical protein